MDLPLPSAPLLAVIRRHWILIGVFGLVTGASAAAVNWFVLDPRYGASAMLMMFSDRLDLSFDPKFRNLPEEHLDLTTRRRTLETLAASAEVVTRVLERVQARLRPAERDPLGFRDWADFSGSGEVFRIHAVTRDPDLSADVANAWADTLREAADTSFGFRHPEREMTRSQAAECLGNYKKAQASLADFLQKDPSIGLESALRVKRAQVEGQRQASLRIQRSLRDLERLLSQCKAGGAKSGAVGRALRLAMLLARLSALESFDAGTGGYAVDPRSSSAEMRPPLAFHLSLEGTDVAQEGDAFVADLERMINDLRVSRDALEKSATDPALLQEISGLQAEVERLSGVRRELIGARDVAWETFQTVSRKAEETRVAVEVGASVVRVASHAVPDREPESPRRAFNTLAATVAGLTLGFVVACLGPGRGLVFGELASEAPPPAAR